MATQQAQTTQPTEAVSKTPTAETNEARQVTKVTQRIDIFEAAGAAGFTEAVEVCLLMEGIDAKTTEISKAIQAAEAKGVTQSDPWIDKYLKNIQTSVKESRTFLVYACRSLQQVRSYLEPVLDSLFINQDLINEIERGRPHGTSLQDGISASSAPLEQQSESSAGQKCAVSEVSDSSAGHKRQRFSNGEPEPEAQSRRECTRSNGTLDAAARGKQSR